MYNTVSSINFLVNQRYSIHRSLSKLAKNSIEEEQNNVCIVGGGPSGMLLSHLLSCFGIFHVIVDRKVAPTSHPQAHFINNRSMEILKDWVPNVFRHAVNQSPNSQEWR